MTDLSRTNFCDFRVKIKYFVESLVSALVFHHSEIAKKRLITENREPKSTSRFRRFDAFVYPCFPKFITCWLQVIVLRRQNRV
jgi:hypothetical protein